MQRERSRRLDGWINFSSAKYTHSIIKKIIYYPFQTDSLSPTQNDSWPRMFLILYTGFRWTLSRWALPFARRVQLLTSQTVWQVALWLDTETIWTTYRYQPINKPLGSRALKVTVDWELRVSMLGWEVSGRLGERDPRGPVVPSLEQLSVITAKPLRRT